MEHVSDTIELDPWDSLVGVVDEYCKPGIHHEPKELRKLVDRINAEGPVFFVRESGLITEQPWFVRRIEPITMHDKQGREDIVLHIVLSPKNNFGIEEQYALGEFFSKRVLGPRRIKHEKHEQRES